MPKKKPAKGLTKTTKRALKRGGPYSRKNNKPRVGFEVGITGQR
jgi:hypothetical protein